MPQADEVFFLDRYYWERLKFSSLPSLRVEIPRSAAGAPQRTSLQDKGTSILFVLYIQRCIFFDSFEILRNHVLLKTHKPLFLWFVKSQRLLYLASRKGRGLSTLEQECLTTRRGCGYLVENLPIVSGRYVSPQYADPYNFNNIITFQ